MAIYHFHVSIIQRSKGHSAVASAAYRSGEVIHDQRIDKTFDYGRRHGILYTDIMAPDNAPAWMRDRAALWNGVEEFEDRKNSQLARSIDISLMSELPIDKNIDLIRAYVKEQFVDKGMIADIAIHEPGRDSDTRNVHAHIMVTMRDIDGETFADHKNRSWNKDDIFLQWRQKWAEHANRMLEHEGFAERIDHRSLLDQGIIREPTIHEGPAARGMERKYKKTSDRMEQNRELKSINEELDRLQADLKKAEEHLAELQRLKATGDAAGPSRDTDKPPQREPLQPPTGMEYPPGQAPPGSSGGRPDHMPDDLSKDQAAKDEQERQRIAADAEKARQDQEARNEADRLKKIADDEKTRQENIAKTEADRQQKLAEYNKRVEELAWENAQRNAAQAEEMRREYARQQELNRKAEFDKHNAEVAQNAQEIKQKLKDANARAIQEQQAQGYFREAGMRYGAALAAHYDMADPYGSLAKSAMAEYAAFIKERETYTKQIAEENDPVKRQSLELRKRIEGADYLALTGERIAKQSELITGRLNSDEAVKERGKVAYWQAQSKEARQALRDLGRGKEQDKDQGKEQPEQGRPRRPRKPSKDRYGDLVDQIAESAKKNERDKDKKGRDDRDRGPDDRER